MMRLYAQFLAAIVALIAIVALVCACTMGPGDNWGVVCGSAITLWVAAFGFAAADGIE